MWRNLLETLGGGKIFSLIKKRFMEDIPPPLFKQMWSYLHGMPKLVHTVHALRHELAPTHTAE